MNLRSFSLKPFSLPPHWPDILISGTINRQVDLLNISYTLSGPLSSLNIPHPSGKPNPAPGEVFPTATAGTFQAKPCRKGKLWEETCFEFFLAAEGTDEYWEFNLSPAGHWNVYHFEKYRQGMREESSFLTLPYQVQTTLTSIALDLSCPLPPGIKPGSPVKMAISTVLKLTSGEYGYFALAHPAPEPDFHHPKSFLLNL